MPVKVRCPGCEKVLNAPDRARGKAVRCPNCQTVVRVPPQTAKGDRAAAPAARRPARQRAAGETGEDFLAGVDLRRAEDTRVRVCVKCGAEVDEETIDCPSCGHNVETGVISERMRLKLARKGPPPEEFWGAAWSDSWAFLVKNWRLAVRTATYYTVFLTLLNFSFYMGHFYCTRIPTKTFWFVLAAVFNFGTVGWFWYLAIRVIQHTMQRSPRRRNQRMERIDFDFFASMALGVKFVVWPIVLLSPVLFALAAIGGALQATGTDVKSMQTVMGIAGTIAYLFPYLCFAVAMVHMTMPYTYKAWIAYHMGRLFFRNIGPALYWLVLAIVVHLPLLMIGAIVFAAGLVDQPRDLFFYEPWAAQLSADILGVRDVPSFIGDWDLGIFEAVAAYGLAFACFIILSLMVTLPISFIAAFPAVFSMRANGLVGLYFRPELELVTEQEKGKPCGFWVRYLAMLIDGFLWPLASVLVFKSRIVLIVAWLINAVVIVLFLSLPSKEYAIMFSSLVWPLYNAWMYFATTEGSPEQCTIGKYAMGIIVTDMEGKMIDIPRATSRFFSKLIGGLPLAAGWIMTAFTPDKQALHDTINRTLVVWRGEETRAND